ncbi:hypothetical protein ACVIGA_005455 [Bradyrhizobium sp. USDA 3240]
MICDLVAKRPHRSGDAKQRRGHGPHGLLRNGLWPKYGSQIPSGGTHMAGMFCAYLKRLTKR